MKKPSESASNLKEIINRAIKDLEVTPDEYQQIMNGALDDGHIDNEEKALLSEFHGMINNGTIKRVRG